MIVFCLFKFLLAQKELKGKKIKRHTHTQLLMKKRKKNTHKKKKKVEKHAQKNKSKRTHSRGE